MSDKLNTDDIRLQDILSAISDIEQFLERSNLNDKMTIMATSYGIAIIGEAASKLSSHLREHYSQVPWDNIIGMRHRLIHAYGQVSIERLKEVTNVHLPQLKQSILTIIADRKII